MSGLSGRAERELARLEMHGIRPGLEAIRALLDAMGHPERTQSVLVAGTNGKGSCASMLHSILAAAGRRVGLYTSPHLVDVTERIRVDSADISGEQLSELLEEVVGIADGLRSTGQLEREPTYFEVMTACAFLHFHRERCEQAVLEVGMGGRFDATNAVDPILSILTSISRDHEQYLGETLPAIAREKAGIFRAGVPVVSAIQPAEVEAVLIDCARDTRTHIEFADPAALEYQQLDNGCYAVRPAGADWITLPLPGLHQVGNAALVIAACRHLPGIDSGAVRRGIEACRWPGRLELVARSPDIYLDGCHNPAGAASAAAFVRTRPNRRHMLVFGCMRDKDIAEMSRELFPEFDTVILTQVDSARAATPDEIRSAAKDFGGALHLEPDLARIIGRGWSWKYGPVVPGHDAMILIAGSLYLIGAARRLAEE